jgi:hypothetical protein
VFQLPLVVLTPLDIDSDSRLAARMCIRGNLEMLPIIWFVNWNLISKKRPTSQRNLIAESRNYSMPVELLYKRWVEI